jgi:hypothetical protein
LFLIIAAGGVAVRNIAAGQALFGWLFIPRARAHVQIGLTPGATALAQAFCYLFYDGVHDSVPAYIKDFN